MFGNIGFPELLVILAIDEIKEKIEEEIQAEEFKDIQEEIKKDFSEDEEGKKIS